MMWFMHVKADMAVLPDMIDYYNRELVEAHTETRISGSLEKQSQSLPGQVSHRFDQLQEIESVLKYLNVKYDKMRSDHYRRYLERYNRELSDRSIEKYIDGEADIVDMLGVINEVALVRNKYLGIMKGFDAKSYSLGNITRLRIAGMNDSVL
jgi:hypothetical protein